jgi:threonine dehydrogenase-like Zn-dependent dehydrogenase
MTRIPLTQSAVQLVGADELILNTSKEIVEPVSDQILCRVEAVGLCFSDLKLLKQFSSHARKGPVISGIEQSVLDEISSYVPSESPAVPGHESVVRVVAVGSGVDNIIEGGRYLVQTDYRWLRTSESNASFGYNFEGALQEYVLMDQRVITSPSGRSMLIPACEGLSASSVALVEPWACVENAYSSSQRQEIKEDGELLIYADVEVTTLSLQKILDSKAGPRGITFCSKQSVSFDIGQEVRRFDNISELEDQGYDDVIYFGSDAETIEALFGKVGAQGLFNIVLCQGRVGRNVVTPVGRVHYGGIRIIGTTGSDWRESMGSVPKTGEIRSGDRIYIVGAGGPMGLMHVIRSICSGVDGVSVTASDLDSKRMAVLRSVAEPESRKNSVTFETVDSNVPIADDSFDYAVLMAPVPGLVVDAVRYSAAHGIINIFAGIPATVSAKIDINSYVEKRLYFIGTSGSVLEDMEKVLGQTEAGRLDPDLSVAAISGLDGAAEGIKAVENRTIAGKVIVYPCCKGLGLIRLEELVGRFPEVASCLNQGRWCKGAEDALLKVFED